MKKIIARLFLLLFLATISVISFTRVTNDYSHSMLVADLYENTDYLIFTNDYNHVYTTPPTSQEVVDALEAKDIYMLQLTSVDGKSTLYYTNPSSSQKGTIESYKDNCKIECINLIETDYASLNKSQGFEFSKDKKSELKSVLDSLNVSYVIPVDEEPLIGITNEDDYTPPTTQAGMIVEAVYNGYMLYVNIFISMLILLCFIVILETLEKTREIRLHAMLGFKYHILLKHLFKHNFKTTILPYLLFSLVISYIYYPSFTNLYYTFILLIALVFLLLFFITVISAVVYYNISKKLMHNFSRVIIISVSAILVLFSISLINSISNVTSYISLNRVQVSNSEFADDFFKIQHDLSLTFDEHEIITNYLIENDQAIYVYYIPPIYEGYRAELEVDAKFFERNPQITTKDGEEIDYNEIINSLAPSNEEIEAARDVTYDDFTDEEIVQMITPTPLFVSGRNISSGENNIAYSSSSNIYIDDDDSKYYTFDIRVGEVTLDDVQIMVVDNDLFVSNIFIKSSSIEEAREIVSDAYEANGIEFTVDVETSGLNTGVDASQNDSRDSFIAALIGLISLVFVVVLYINLILEKNKNHILISTIYGFGKVITQKHLLIEIFITNTFVILYIFIKSFDIASVTLFIVMLLTELIVIQIKTRAFVRQNITTYLKGELQGD